MFGRDYDYSIIRTTSKDALKRTALMATGNDIKKAMEIYDFFVKDLSDMPDYDPIQPSGLEQVRDMAAQVFKWGEQNQDKIMNGINLILQMIGKQPIGVSVAPTEVPPPIA